ncbi:hypothetical protein MHK12_06655 [Corynebacterium kefirresidentii]|uniref:hypothetical protein n=1 Tax=Corynebacterium TaxID=1716 RepID=UPI001EF397FB|nr:hypothetical protein [Corynebacterium kefirresidentii]MCG7449323.1 hypothetical protein [Corynebacterium kefirresidentii]MCG7452428.1 hypothetical protein [Corynebacterium kefirresidentii]
MDRISGRTVVKTPTGLRVPLFLYAVSIAVSIAAGSATAMYKLSFPWWVWAAETLILLPIVYVISRDLTTADGSEGYVVVSKPKVIGFATISAIVIVLLIMLAVL